MSDIAVIICAHNPREDFLRAALSALQAQTLPFPRWDLVLVDNASTKPLANRFNVGWHPLGRIVCGRELGLTKARLNGLTQTTAPLLVYVDDDNVLAPDYLETVLRVAAGNLQVGVWSGSVELEFETSPPEWTRPYRTFLAERRIEQNQISSDSRLVEPLPVGAGLCVRREAMQRYMDRVVNDPLRQELDRNGKQLSSGGDTDIALTISEEGWDRGVFKALRVRHLIPSDRMTEDYLVRLAAGIRFSTNLLERIHEPRVLPLRANVWWWIKYRCDCATKFGRKLRFYKAYKQADLRARAVCERHAAEIQMCT